MPRWCTASMLLALLVSASLLAQELRFSAERVCKRRHTTGDVASALEALIDFQSQGELFRRAAAPLAIWGTPACETATEKVPYPTVLLVNSADPAVPKTCMGVVVGPRAVITAAHCISDHRTFVYVPPSVAAPVSLQCNQVPQMPPHSLVDLALCKADRPLVPAPSFIATTDAWIDETQLKYSCTGDCHIDHVHVLFAGRDPSGTTILVGHASTVGPSVGADSILTADSPKHTSDAILALQEGDSGGPGFAEVEGRRHLVAITFRTQAQMGWAELIQLSKVRPSIERWQAQECTRICGVDPWPPGGCIDPPAQLCK